MHKCEFCHNNFIPRLQVKNPRACKNSQCQLKRQRSNEKEWKNKHIPEYDKQYHQVQKKKRSKLISSTLESILDCLTAGTKLFGRNCNMANFKAHLNIFLSRLGIRKINKFWINENTFNTNEIGAK